MEKGLLVINGDETSEKLTEINNIFLKGWMLDPMFKSNPIRLDTAAIYHIIKYTEEELEALTKGEEEEVTLGEFDDLTGAISVNLGDEVEEKIKEGYKVYKIYAKNVVMIKREEVK